MVPVLNLRDYFGDSAITRAAFVKNVGDALREVGFFALEGHGIESELIQSAYSTLEDFFQLSDKVKKEYEDVPGSENRGYISYGREKALGAKASDLKEFWHIGRVADADPSIPKNIWPTEVSHFEKVFCELYTQLDQLSLTLLEACSIYLEQDASFLGDMAKGGNSIIRAIHYPPLPEDVNPESIRAAAHEDINFITLLCESTAAGLELLTNDGKWLPIESKPGQIVVDSGDMIQNLTNGLFRSTTHRVVNPDDERTSRFSLPFFVHPRPEVSLAPMPYCIEKMGGTVNYESITAEEYLDQRLCAIGVRN